jgi:hypothetical protein
MATLATPVHQMSSAEFQVVFDRAARSLLNMSGEEFLKKWNNNEFGENPDEIPGVMEVASLIQSL